MPSSRKISTILVWRRSVSNGKTGWIKSGGTLRIAVPESFEAALESFGARLVYRRRFADHHRFSQQEIIDTLNEAEAAGAEALTTKDAVRFPYMERRDLPLLYIPGLRLKC